ncbi:MAG TPA: GNAT family N-acetyltransferase [Pseudonocardiaceae bacterium]|jgi:predicted GNAT family acetyltransferase|nr:GNAT family N-acetyltransferase [Pseudonocardiaceae bacterium]
MKARLHADIAGFAALARPLLEADPVRHSIALTALALQLRAPQATADQPVLLTAHHGAVTAGAALCVIPYDLIASALPATAAPAAADLLAVVHPSLRGAVGPRAEAETFAATWSARTGALVRERMAQQLFALRRLTPPAGVRGTARRAGPGDVELLTRWLTDFAAEATGGLRETSGVARHIRRSMTAGNAALMWEADGDAVAWASVNLPVAGMSRIGPVYTLPEHRGHGYGSAVTAAAAGWARQAGARHVVLLTDLANPVPNAIYPRLGFRPVHDTVQLEFTPAP